MKVVIQRVSQAQVNIDNRIHNQISHGLLLFVCLEQKDNQATINKAAEKIARLRIFNDDKGLMNLSINDIQGEVLSISQFTLSWEGTKGHRPSFDKSMAPMEARLFYELFNKELVKRQCRVKTGVFGADMKIISTNDGPVTFHLSF